MTPIKTIRDDFALAFLAPMIGIDQMRQAQGFPPQNAVTMMQAAYSAADGALMIRDAHCKPEDLKATAPQIMQ